MAAKYLGAHMPTSGGLGNAVRSGHAIGCTAVQVFTNSPQQWRAKPITDAMVADFRAALVETGIEKIVSHDSYLVNLCSPDPDKRAQSIAGLTAELVRCHAYGIPYAVSHMGAQMGAGEEEGLRIVAESALVVLDQTPEDVTILMETTAGQGSSLVYKFEHLARLLELTKGHPRLCVCMDTCHIFAAGYDIRDAEAYTATMDAFGSLVGFDRLKAVHCNDSKNPLGSRKDRHQNIGEGDIGPDAFKLLVNDPRFDEIPIMLETPDAPEGHAINLARLREYQAK